MPSRAHENLLALFRRDPRLAAELAAKVAGRALPDEIIIRDRHCVLPRPSLDGVEHHVELDLLLSIHGRDPNGEPGELLRQIWIIEVQLGRKRDRIAAWTFYYLAVLARFELAPSEVDILVVCPLTSVRRWLERRVLARMKAQPLLLEPHHVPRIDDLDLARARPEAAVLSAVFHGHELSAAPIVEAACHAIEALETSVRDNYLYLIQTAAHRAMTLPLPLQAPALDDTPSEWEQRGLTWAEHGERFAAQGRIEGRTQGLQQGRAQGLQQGLAQGLQQGLAQARREALLMMLRLERMPVSPAQRQHIEACEDPELLERWIHALEQAKSVTELLSARA